MNLKNLFAGKKLKRTDGTDIDAGDVFDRVQRETMSLEQFRDAVWTYILQDKMDALHDLCEDQIIMTPIFFQKLIREIRPDNDANDLLFLTARKMLEAYPDPIIDIFSGELERKRPLIKHPTAGKEIIERYVNIIPFRTLAIEKNLRVPNQIFRLLKADMANLDVNNASSIDTVFAEMVILGPGFFVKYIESSSLDEYCARAGFRVPMGTPPKVMEFFGGVLLDKARVLPLVHPEFEAILTKYRNGIIRSATDEEKSLFYALIDFDIEYPVYVIESEEGRLLVYLQSGTRIYWLEYLDLWNQGGLAKPTLDLLKKRFK